MNPNICRECGNLHTRFESCGATGQQTVKALWEERDQLRRKLEEWRLCAQTLKAERDSGKLVRERDEAVAHIRNIVIALARRDTDEIYKRRVEADIWLKSEIDRLDGEGGA